MKVFSFSLFGRPVAEKTGLKCLYCTEDDFVLGNGKISFLLEAFGVEVKRSVFDIAMSELTRVDTTLDNYFFGTLRNSLYAGNVKCCSFAEDYTSVRLKFYISMKGMRLYAISLKKSLMEDAEAYVLLSKPDNRVIGSFSYEPNAHDFIESKEMAQVLLSFNDFFDR